MKITFGLRESTGKGFASLSGLTGKAVYIDVERGVRLSNIDANWKPEYEAMKASMEAVHTILESTDLSSAPTLAKRAYTVADQALAAAGDD